VVDQAGALAQEAGAQRRVIGHGRDEQVEAGEQIVCDP
jgi:hypothetical protein